MRDRLTCKFRLVRIMNFLPNTVRLSRGFCQLFLNQQKRFLPLRDIYYFVQGDFSGGVIEKNLNEYN